MIEFALDSTFSPTLMQLLFLYLLQMKILSVETTMEYSQTPYLVDEPMTTQQGKVATFQVTKIMSTTTKWCY